MEGEAVTGKWENDRGKKGRSTDGTNDVESHRESLSSYI